MIGNGAIASPRKAAGKAQANRICPHQTGDHARKTHDAIEALSAEITDPPTARENTRPAGVQVARNSYCSLP